MILALLSLAWAGTDWLATARDLGAKPADDGLILEVSDLADAASEADKPRLEAAMRMANALGKKAKAWSVDERQLAFEVALMGTAAEAGAMLEGVKAGNLPSGPLLPRIYARAVASEQPAAVLAEWRGRGLDADAQARVELAEAIAFGAGRSDPEVHRQIGEALGLPSSALPPAPPAPERPIAEALPAAAPGTCSVTARTYLPGADEALRARIADAIEMCELLANETTASRRKFLLTGALAPDAATRSGALMMARETAAPPDPTSTVATSPTVATTPTVAPTPTAPTSTPDDEPLIGPEPPPAQTAEYLARELRIVDTTAPMGSFITAGYNGPRKEALATKTWGIREGSRELTAIEASKRLGTYESEYLPQRSRRKRAVAWSFVGAGGSGLLGLIGLNTTFAFLYEGENQLATVAGLGTVASVLGAGALTLNGIGNARAASYEGRYPSLLMNKNRTTDRIDAYNADLRSELGISDRDVTAAKVAGMEPSEDERSKLVVRIPTDEPISAAPDLATVVFVRPKRKWWTMSPAILDTDGDVICVVKPETHCVARVPPGQHTFITWGEDAPTLQADVDAGKTYFVYVEPRMGALGRLFLVGMGPSRPMWSELPEMLRSTTRWVPVPDAADRLERERAPIIQDMLETSARKSGAYTAAERDSRSLDPEDGVTDPMP
ncbi:MAG: hypothetical protein H6737_28795 [Alphaproteobacteria bacterium]|nr:hypothetical protein [Alphaproteobacteria bacterium]